MTDIKLSAPQWMAEARKAAKHFWAYEDLVDDADDLLRCYEAGDDPYDAVKAIGQSLDLFEFGPAWGGW